LTLTEKTQLLFNQKICDHSVLPFPVKAHEFPLCSNGWNLQIVSA